MAQTRQRAWCFTHQVQLDNDAFEAAQPQLHEHFRYIVYQTEVAPDTGRVHIQGYIEFKQPMRFAAVKTLLGGQAHLERRRGTRLQARDYCMKEDSRMPGTEFTEIGDWNAGGQGRRVDLTQSKKKIRELATYRKCLDEDELDSVTARHPRWVADQLTMVSRTIRNPPIVTVYHGPTNTGKTYRCFLNNPGLHAVRYDNGFVDYSGQTHVLFDEFDKKPWPFGLMLQLLDRYPLRINIKNGYIWWEPTHIFITSTEPPEAWFVNDKGYQTDYLPQLLRRLTSVINTTGYVPPQDNAQRNDMEPVVAIVAPGEEHSEHSMEMNLTETPPTVEMTVSEEEDEFNVLGGNLPQNSQ